MLLIYVLIINDIAKYYVPYT